MNNFIIMLYIHDEIINDVKRRFRIEIEIKNCLLMDFNQTKLNICGETGLSPFSLMKLLPYINQKYKYLMK